MIQVSDREWTLKPDNYYSFICTVLNLQKYFFLRLKDRKWACTSVPCKTCSYLHPGPTFKCLNHNSLRNHVQLLLHDTKIDAVTSLKLPALHWWWTSLSHHIDRCELILWFPPPILYCIKMGSHFFCNTLALWWQATLQECLLYYIL